MTQQARGRTNGEGDSDWRPVGEEEHLRSPYLHFDRAQWAGRREDTPLTLTPEDLVTLQGINEAVSITEVEEVYLPLTRLIDLHLAATVDLYRATQVFLRSADAQVPYVIGMAGSVAVGKSTTARILQALLSRLPGCPRVALVTTDGFLYPNAVLEAKGLMGRKGFPESYDLRALIDFVHRIKSGVPRVESPVYSHLTYDIVPGERVVVEQADIVIVEGLNVLQSPEPGPRRSQVFVSDYFDFTIYVDANPEHVRQWFIERFLTLRDTAFRNPASYFRSYAHLTDEQAVARAETIWRTINEVNLYENILPTRERAKLILVKGVDHSVREVRLRKL